MLLNFSVQMGTGESNMVNPLTEENVLMTVTPVILLPHPLDGNLEEREHRIKTSFQNKTA
jgi:hypothetical protein